MYDYSSFVEICYCILFRRNLSCSRNSSVDATVCSVSSAVHTKPLRPLNYWLLICQPSLVVYDLLIDCVHVCMLFLLSNVPFVSLSCMKLVMLLLACSYMYLSDSGVLEKSKCRSEPLFTVNMLTRQSQTSYFAALLAHFRLHMPG